MINYCPLPRQWNEIYITLKKAWLGQVSQQPKLQPPPFPLILDHWANSTDTEKFQRWEATLGWAESMNLRSLIPAIETELCYPVCHSAQIASPFDNSCRVTA